MTDRHDVWRVKWLEGGLAGGQKQEYFQGVHKDVVIQDESLLFKRFQLKDRVIQAVSMPGAHGSHTLFMLAFKRAPFRTGVPVELQCLVGR